MNLTPDSARRLRTTVKRAENTPYALALPRRGEPSPDPRYRAIVTTQITAASGDTPGVGNAKLYFLDPITPLYRLIPGSDTAPPKVFSWVGTAIAVNTVIYVRWTGAAYEIAGANC